MDVYVSVNQSGGQYCAQFQCQLSTDEKKFFAEASSPKIAMSRSGKSCFTPVIKLEEHNGHSPSFGSKEELEEYVERVRTDLMAAAAGMQTTEVKDVKGLTGPEKFGLDANTDYGHGGLVCLVCGKDWLYHMGWTCLNGLHKGTQ